MLRKEGRHGATEELDSESAAEPSACVDQDGQAKLPPQEERSDTHSPEPGLSSGHPPDVKDQGSLSKMPTKNGLMMQVRRGPRRGFKVLHGRILRLRPKLVLFI